MRPNREAPLLAADEVGVVILDLQIVYRLQAVGHADRIDPHAPSFKRHEEFARLDRADGQPTQPFGMEGVFESRLDQAAFDDEFDNRRQPLEDPLHSLEFDRPLRVVLIAGGEPIVLAELVDPLESFRRDEFRFGSEASDKEVCLPRPGSHISLLNPTWSPANKSDPQQKRYLAPGN